MRKDFHHQLPVVCLLPTTVCFFLWSAVCCLPSETSSWNDCFLAYQKFLYETPPAGRPMVSDTEAEKEEKREQHRRIASRYAEFSDKFSTFARQSDLFPPTAPPDIKRERSQKITGTWNLYKNVPLNALDLWTEACYMKFRSLHHAAIADPEKLDMLNDYAAELEKQKVLDPLFQTVKRTWFGATLRLLHENTDKNPDTFSNLVADYTKFLGQYPTLENLSVAEPILDLAEQIKQKTADEQLRQAFIKIQRESDNFDLRNFAGVFEGVLRRQELLGQELPIWGNDIDGKPFDPKTLEGKVVLLDFWATWCGSCIAEFPRLKKLYEKYREQGFEIVGYSVDSDLESVYAYLKQNPLPWIVLTKETSRTLDRPLLSSYYGARQLPIVLLRDRNGKAVLLDARGEPLEKMLEMLLKK